MKKKSNNWIIWIAWTVVAVLFISIAWALFPPLWGKITQKAEIATTQCPVCACDTDALLIKEAYDNCKVKAEAIGAPPEMVKAICIPAGTGSVSDRLPVGTEVKIGTITFDAEDRVWVLQNFVTPKMANYSFEYIGAEMKLFEAPFVVGSELGWADDGTRVPFKICWDVTSVGCLPPADLFPTK
jgi:hypothetical protein